MDTIGIPFPRSRERTWAPFLLVLGIALVAGAGSVVLGGATVLLVLAGFFLALVVARPHYGIAVFLSTFLMTYPRALQGVGFLTINNVLGLVFLVLLAYKVYRERDWWFVTVPEVQLLGFVVAMYYISGWLNGPDPHTLELLGEQELSAANMRIFVNRVAFTVFFIAFIRTPDHVRMIYLLGLAFMVASALSGVQGVIQGGGLYGYRATTEARLVAAAYNPNRLAMLAVFSVAGLWYLRRSLTLPGLKMALLLAIAVMGLAVFMTASRSGLLGLVVCFVSILWDERVGVRAVVNWVVGALLVGVLVAQFVPERSLERITNLPGTQQAQVGEGAGSLERRGRAWEVAWELFLDSPFLGVGMGNWEIARFLKDPARSTAAPHSSYLLTLVEGGVFCLSAFLVLLWRTWRNFRLAEEWMSMAPPSAVTDLLWIAKAAKVSLISLAFFSLVADLWQFVLLFWLIGIGVVLRRLVEADMQRLRLT
ncbi:MAG: bifunctional O-antigen ligase/aminoglycoside phosphotransferase family protein [Candidatus Binatia bacterium]|nr:bifunctional O-antigen ligase/aminoglycoside phosphotransferase family protein [Candidatus Binatia bacterium]